MSPNRMSQANPGAAGVRRLADKRATRPLPAPPRSRLSSRVVIGLLLVGVSSLLSGQAGQPGSQPGRPAADSGSAGSAGSSRPTGADGGTVPSVSMPTYSSVSGTPSGPSNSVPSGVAGPGGARSSSVSGGSKGIPATVLAAYEHAAAQLSTSEPGCHLPVALLAGIGEVESGQARSGRVDANGTALQPILGPVLDGGNGTAAIPDTDHGVLDGNAVWDRAVGPMQFIPSTWRHWASDGNGDGVSDPENIYDAALAAGRYLCAGNRDLSTQSGMDSAILSYNDSSHYLQLVLAWEGVYSGAVVAVADATGIGPSAPVASAPSTTATAPPSSTVSAPPTGSTPPSGPTQPAPPSSTQPGAPGAPTTTPAAPPTTGTPGNPVVTLLCGVGNIVDTGVGGLLGGLLGQPDQSQQPEGCTQPTTAPEGN
jgi:hypothetical protein